MLQFTLKRLGLALLVALTVSIISFSLLFLSGYPAAALGGENGSRTVHEARP
ncbi:MAG: ABC transporter permease, partial [Planctomycetes bacterium]|nr:ABC transporter permease [Planctomycetota bacterium]